MAFRLGLRRKGPARAIHVATRDLTFRNRSGDGTLVLPSEYLEVVIERNR
ncbi:hypothetical protein [Cupriavidus basilensis]|uniref:Uncharacterized protein n=1 Tax=Cupriavidus basilensis TaxID=68895 RepID=A0A7M2HAG7_9BURK|nr:hypothetical protein [Cupriavidus basilensis]QOT81537.1 hypothetical protein F7R26_024735 [Cupriavidus basilensis]